MALQTEEPCRFQSATVISKIIKIKDLPANPCLQDSRNYQIVRILPYKFAIKGRWVMVLNLARRDFKSAGLRSSWIYISNIISMTRIATK